MLRSGAKGSTPEAYVTSTPINDDHQGLDVVVHSGDDGGKTSDLNRLPVDAGDVNELLKSINDRLGALLILIASQNSRSDEPTSLIRAAQTDLRA